MIINNIKLSNFNNINAEEKLMILEWRNNDNIRKWMHNSNIISKENHFIFLKKLKNDMTKEFFLLSKNNNYIGVIYFSNINNKNKSAEFGLYSNPNLRGIGKILQETVCTYALSYLKLKKLSAEVLKDNTSALRLYKKFKFKESNNTSNNHKIVYLELSIF